MRAPPAAPRSAPSASRTARPARPGRGASASQSSSARASVFVADEARLEEVGSGLAPVSPGWFVVNARDAAWLTHDVFGARCVFEADGPVLRRRPDLPVQRFEQLGFALAVLEPGRPSALYHAESGQEDYLVLAGEWVLLVENVERGLRAWDFVHCPPGTAHAFVDAGDERCVLLMTGARTGERSIVYPSSELARRHGAGVGSETTSAFDAYAPYGHWQPERPAGFDELSWRGRP